MRLLSNPQRSRCTANTLAAYRILHADPVLFSESLVLQWQPHDESKALEVVGFPIACNDGGQGGGWPSAALEHPPSPRGDPELGVVDITTFAWVYTY